MGLGLLGRGVGDVEFLAECGAELIVTDLKSAEELAPSLRRLEQFSDITFVLGEHRLEDFRGRDLILKAAGVPLNNPYTAEAENHGIPVEMSTALFADLSGARIIGVTGTRGKSTVTHLIFEALEAESRSGRFEGRVFLGGNVRGLSTLALLREVREGDTVVLELDSWQLQGFKSRGISPHVAVFTTFMPDHMNYYHNDLRAYFKDKAAIYESQTPADFLVVSEQVEEYMDTFDMRSRGPKVSVVRAEDVLGLPDIMMLGKHNRLNAALALEALRLSGAYGEELLNFVREFKGVVGRLELVAEKGGIRFYNDTTSTTPEALFAAVGALQGEAITLIAGGSDKGLDFEPALNSFRAVNGLVLLPGGGTDRLMSEGDDSLRARVVLAQSMDEAVKVAHSLTKEGGVILLSPGCASFGLFENEFDRGDRFVEAVNKL